MTPIPDDVQAYIDLVRCKRYRSCPEQFMLCDLVERVFASENLTYDNEQIAKYFENQKYFPFDLFEWEKFCFVLHNCVYREDGELRWPEMLLYVGRGAGKNGYLSFEDFCLLSPVHGVRNYDIDISANSEDQAKTTFKELYEILDSSTGAKRKKLEKHFGWNKTEIVCKDTNSTLRYRTNNPRGKDSLRPGKVDFDEVHAYINWDNITVFTTGLGKKPYPRITNMSTNGDIREGPLEQMVDKSMLILQGEIPDNGFLPFICRLSTDIREAKELIKDKANWTMANPSLPYLKTLRAEMEREYIDYVFDPVTNNGFMTKRMNVRENSNKIVEVASWDNILRTNEPVPDLAGRVCVAGIDYMKTTDFLGVYLLFYVGGKWTGIHHSWYCAASNDLCKIKFPLAMAEDMGLLTKVDDVEINPEHVTNWLQEQREYYSIAKIAIDSYRHTLLASSLAKIGFSAVDGDVKLIRPSDIMLVQPIICSAFLNGQFVWGDDPLMRWYANNTILVPEKRNNFSFDKIERRSRKNDGFMALAAAMTIRDELPDDVADMPFSVMTF